MLLINRASFPIELHLSFTANPVSSVQVGAPSGNQAPGMMDIFKEIVREEGPRGLYRGLLPNFLKVIPAVSIGYVVYEQVKLLLGVETVK